MPSIRDFITSALAALFLLTSATSASAKDKWNRYQSVTSVALSSYRLCLPETGMQDLLTASKNFVSLAAKQEETSPLFDRLLNWHFHDAFRDTDDAMPATLIGADTSIHRIHQQRVDDLVEAISDKDIRNVYDNTGRLLHHLQDMAIPANVAPIYHHQLLDFADADPFTELSLWKRPRYVWVSSTCDIDTVGLDELRTAIPALLDKTAERTRDRIRAQITTDVDHPLAGQTWEAFWTLRRPEDDADYQDVRTGFAPYGYQGEEGFARLCSTDRELCQQFFNGRYADAVDASIQALLLINAVLNELERPAPE